MTRERSIYEQIPVSVLEQHEGEWIVWDQDEEIVVGTGETLEEAEHRAMVRCKGRDHLLRIHHVLPRSLEIA